MLTLLSHGMRVRLLDAPVSKKIKKYIGKVAIIIAMPGKGWYTVRIKGTEIVVKWRGEKNIEKI
jgi:hypothetical protein